MFDVLNKQQTQTESSRRVKAKSAKVEYKNASRDTVSHYTRVQLQLSKSKQTIGEFEGFRRTISMLLMLRFRADGFIMTITAADLESNIDEARVYID
mgnify:CR=1 FL=1